MINKQLKLALLLLTMAPLSSMAETYKVKNYALPNQSVFFIPVPPSWQDTILQPPENLPPTIRFKPISGEPFEVYITPIPPKSPTDKKISMKEIENMVALSAEHAQPSAVEKNLQVKNIGEKTPHGFYFSATDKNPKPGEFRYMTQGIIKLGDGTATFTVLTNTGSDVVVEDTLKAIEQAEMKNK